MKKILLLVFTLIIGLSLLAEPLHLVTLEYPPYQYLKDGNIEGEIPIILNKTFEKIDTEITITMHPWEKSLAMVKNGEADGIFTIFKTPERDVFLDYSDVILVLQKTAFFSLKESKIDFTGDLAEVKTFKIGVVNSVSYGDVFDKAVLDNQLQTKVFETTKACFEALQNGEIDLVVNNVDGAEVLIKELDAAESIIQKGPAIEKIPSYLAFSKKNKLDKVKSEFDEMLEKVLDR